MLQSLVKANRLLWRWILARSTMLRCWRAMAGKNSSRSSMQSQLLSIIQITSASSLSSAIHRFRTKIVYHIRVNHWTTAVLVCIFSTTPSRTRLRACNSCTIIVRMADLPQAYCRRCLSALSITIRRQHSPLPTSSGASPISTPCVASSACHRSILTLLCRGNSI
jgi:hypothetical protein